MNNILIHILLILVAFSGPIVFAAIALYRYSKYGTVDPEVLAAKKEEYGDIVLVITTRDES